MEERTVGSSGATTVSIEAAAASAQSQTSWREYLNQNQKLYSRLAGIIFIAVAILLTYIIDPVSDETETTASPASTRRPNRTTPLAESDINLFKSYRLHTELSYVGYHDAVLSRNLRAEIVVLVEDEGLIWTAFFYDSSDAEMYHATLYVDGSIPGIYRYVFSIWAPKTSTSREALNVMVPFPRERLTRIKLLFEPFEIMQMTVIDATTFASNLGLDKYFEGTTQDDDSDRYAVGPREENPDHPFYTRRSETQTVKIPETSFSQRYFYYRILLGNYLRVFKSEISSLDPLTSFVGCVSSFYVNDEIKLRTRYDEMDSFAYKRDIAQCNRAIGENFDVEIDEDEE